ncbi:unnamed protein product, partial [Prorocentrum cordatum]
LSPCHWPRLSATDGGCWGSPPAPLGRPRLEKSPAAVGPRRRGEKEEEEDEEEEGGGDGSQACPRQTEAAGAALWRISDARAWKNRQRQLGLGGGGRRRRRRRRRRRKGRRRWVAGLYATDGGGWDLNLSTLNSAAHRNRSKAKLAVPMSAFPGAKTL